MPYQTSDGRENPATGGERVARGCGWGCIANGLRSAYRGNIAPNERYTDIGVRYVRP
jgi:formylglycine-generating enzyme required for sulfatase activity